MKGKGRKAGRKRPVGAQDLSPSNKAAKGVKGGANMGASNYEKKNVTTVKWQGS